jgi:hypothetical protein
VNTNVLPFPQRTRPHVPGEALTRRAVTAVTALVTAMTFTFSLGNVTMLGLRLGISSWIAWLIPAAVDLSVVGLLAGIRFLSLHGYTDAQLRKPRLMLLLCGFLTLALNTAGAVSRHQPGTALVDAVGPALLIGLAEVGPSMLREIHAVTARPQPAPATPPDELLTRARTLDAEHREATGRPISRDTLRGQLRIGRDRAGDLVAILRAQPVRRKPRPDGPEQAPCSASRNGREAEQQLPVSAHQAPCPLILIDIRHDRYFPG